MLRLSLEIVTTENSYSVLGDSSLNVPSVVIVTTCVFSHVRQVISTLVYGPWCESHLSVIEFDVQLEI